MPTWCFKAAARRTRESSTPRWYWQIDTNDTLLAITSNTLFGTIQECIANAREYGFLGEVEIPAALDESSVITCENDGYVDAIAQRALRRRANRPLA